MADRSIVFALANPEPEVDPAEASRARGGGGHRPLGLPEPDQQRAGVPRCLPRAAGCPVVRMITSSYAARCGPRACRRGHRRRAQCRLHHAERVSRRRASHRGRGRPTGRRGSSRIADRHRSCALTDAAHHFPAPYARLDAGLAPSRRSSATSRRSCSCGASTGSLVRRSRPGFRTPTSSTMPSGSRFQCS